MGCLWSCCNGSADAPGRNVQNQLSHEVDGGAEMSSAGGLHVGVSKHSPFSVVDLDPLADGSLRPLVIAVGEQDPFAEQLVFQAFPGPGVGAPGQPQLGGLLAGQGDGDDVTDPARLQNRGDLGLDRGAGAAGAPAGQFRGRVTQPGVGLGQGRV
jgi:hypothetical protein